MAGTRWLYSTDGKPAYYQNGKYLYSAGSSACEYYCSEDENYIYKMAGSTVAFHRSGKWLYTMSGEPAFYYG